MIVQLEVFSNLPKSDKILYQYLTGVCCEPCIFHMLFVSILKSQHLSEVYIAYMINLYINRPIKIHYGKDKHSGSRL